MTQRAVTSDHDPWAVAARRRGGAGAGGEVMCSGEKTRLFPATLIFKEARRKGLAINID